MQTRGGPRRVFHTYTPPSSGSVELAAPDYDDREDDGEERENPEENQLSTVREINFVIPGRERAPAL